MNATLLNKEVWRDIPDAPHYMISNLKRVSSINRIVTSVKCGKEMYIRAKTLKIHGELGDSVSIVYKNKRALYSIQKLFELAFPELATTNLNSNTRETILDASCCGNCVYENSYNGTVCERVVPVKRVSILKVCGYFESKEQQNAKRKIKTDSN